jgi:hypothetical protein
VKNFWSTRQKHFTCLATAKDDDDGGICREHWCVCRYIGS